MARAPAVRAPERPFYLFVMDHRDHLRELALPALDIGTGHGARHTALLQDLGIQTISLDISHKVAANYHGDIRDMQAEPESFSLIFDIKAMCFLADPPIDKIHSWLCPGGFFYCMTPTHKHKEEGAYDVSQGLPVQLYSKEEVRELLHKFADVNIREHSEPIGRTQWLSTWCIEARK